MLGPEGFGKISAYSSGIAHEVCDLLSKNLWGLLGHTIRFKIHQHILLNGNLTKKTKVHPLAGILLYLVSSSVQAESCGDARKGRGKTV